LSLRSSLLLLALPLSAQQPTPQKPPKKGDTVSVDCLRGNAVEQAELLIEDTEGNTSRNDQVPLLTYRLRGDKSALKELGDKHDRKVVQVKGILRSELSGSGIGTTVGRTRITIGSDPRNPTRGAEQQLPVLDAKSFEATTVSCGSESRCRDRVAIHEAIPGPVKLKSNVCGSVTLSGQGIWIKSRPRTLQYLQRPSPGGLSAHDSPFDSASSICSCIFCPGPSTVRAFPGFRRSIVCSTKAGEHS